MQSSNLKTLTYVINKDQPADVLFQNILENDTFFSANNFKQIVFFVPFCKNSDEVRHYAKQYRKHYGADKFYLVDINETYKVHKRAQLQHDTPTPTKLLVDDFLENQGYEGQNLVDF